MFSKFSVKKIGSIVAIALTLSIFLGAAVGDKDLSQYKLEYNNAVKGVTIANKTLCESERDYATKANIECAKGNIKCTPDDAKAWTIKKGWQCSFTNPASK